MSTLVQLVHRGYIAAPPAGSFEAGRPNRLRGRPTGGTEVLLAPGSAGTFLGSVDGWLIATVLLGLWGECFRRYPPPGADWRSQPSS
jgi:hypothetical protein